MNDALREVQGVETAKDSKLIMWTNSWLKTQGPNTLSIVHDKATKKLHIKQGFANKYSSKEFRQQRIDVLLYGEDINTKLLLENILVDSQELTEDILQQTSDSVRARFDELFGDDGNQPLHTLVNANNKGYCLALLDQSTLNFFCENLS